MPEGRGPRIDAVKTRALLKKLERWLEVDPDQTDPAGPQVLYDEDGNLDLSDFDVDELTGKVLPELLNALAWYTGFETEVRYRKLTRKTARKKHK